jgi:hypothetical protein
MLVFRSLLFHKCKQKDDVVTVKDGGMADSKVVSKGAEANSAGDELFDVESLKNDVGAAVVQVNYYSCLYLLRHTRSYPVLILVFTFFKLILFSNAYQLPESDDSTGEFDASQRITIEAVDASNVIQLFGDPKVSYVEFRLLVP